MLYIVANRTNTDTAKDAGKKISVIKLHLAVDILGLTQAMQKPMSRIEMVQNILVDSDYSGFNFANAVGCKAEVVKKSDLHTFKVMNRRTTSKQMTIFALLTLIFRRF